MPTSDKIIAMITTIYIEDEVRDHPRTREIRARLPRATTVGCARYGEVFNRRGQSFRLQKRRPALILAEKRAPRVHECPDGYGVGGARNFYLSPMLNCPYDCRYCFLQGMYRSAHYVVFVNYEDFFADVRRVAADAGAGSWFFTGYDCDSLAFESLTGWNAAALPLFRELPDACFELRTKSVQIDVLLAAEPLDNVVVAMSLTPEPTSRALEHGVPSLERRLAAMARLAEGGWRLGLRFDPVIYHPDYAERYRALFTRVFARLPAASIQSASLGPFRLPRSFFRTVLRHYPDEPLFAGPLAERGAMVSYRRELEEEMLEWIGDELRHHLPAERLFPCAPEPTGLESPVIAG